VVTTVKKNTPIVIPESLRRRAGFKVGDRLEFKLSGGIINVIPELPSADDEYTPAQRRAIDAELAKSLEDVRKGRTYGPFATHKEFLASLHKESKKLLDKTKAKRISK